MSLHTLATLWPGLISSSLLSHLTEEEAQEMLAHSRCQALAANTVFVQPGQPFGDIPLVATGEAEVYQRGPGGSPVVLGRVSRGRSVDLAAVLLGVPARSYARMVTPGHVVWVQTHHLLQTLKRDPNRWAYVYRMTLEVVFQMWTRPFRYHPRVAWSALSALVLSFEKIRVETGGEVCVQNAPQTHVWLLDHGQLGIWEQVDGGPPTHRTFATPHTLLGLQPGAPSLDSLVAPFAPLTLRAHSPCFLWRLDVGHFQDFLRVHPFLLPLLVPPPESATYPKQDSPPEPQQGAIGEQPPPTAQAPKAPWKIWPLKGSWPFVAQEGEADCGAACLAMVCAHLGQPQPLHTLGHLVATTKTGTTLAHIAQGAKKLGLNVSYVPLNDTQGPLPTPFITNQGTHFVVAVRGGAKGVLVADPAAGMRRIPRSLFFDQGAGVGLVVKAPGGPWGSSLGTGPRETVQKGFPKGLLLTPSALLCLLGCSFGLLAGALPWWAQGVDRALGGSGLAADFVTTTWAIFGCLVGMDALFEFLRTRYQIRLSFSLFKNAFEHVFQLPSEIFQKFSSSHLMDFFSLAQHLTGVVCTLAPKLFLYGAIVLGCFLYLVSSFLPAAAVFLLQILLVVSTSLLVSYGLGAPKAQWLHKENEAHLILTDGVRNGTTLKSFGAQGWWQEKWERAFAQALKGRLGVKGVQRALGLGQRILTRAPGALALLWCLREPRTPLLAGYSGPHPLGLAMAFGLGGWAIERAMALMGQWEGLKTLIKRWNFLKDLPHHRPPLGQEGPLTGGVQVQNLTYSYGDGTPALRGISFTISPGQRVGVVGPRGGGKSTLGALLCGLLVPQGGSILLERHGAPPCPPHSSLGGRGVALASSHLPLLAASVGENIALGPHPRWERAEEVATWAQAHGFISRLPRGYHHPLWERGAGLSSGEKACLALARALYPNPHLLFVDGIFQATFGATREALEESMAHMCVGRTVFLVSPPLSTLATCDHILVLAAGNLVEQGTHRDLMAAGGLYAQMAFRGGSP